MIVCVLTDRELVVNVATPPASVPVPMLTPPSRNVTVPLGTPDPATGLTVAVSVIDWPNIDGFAELLKLVEELSTLTVCVTLAD